MDSISNELLSKIKTKIFTYGSELEKSLFLYHIENESSEEVLIQLESYQNSDGGFGNGLEPDFLLPRSSPLATTVAFQLLNDFSDEPRAQKMIERGVAYFEDSFLSKRKGWVAVPKQVNNYPHAPWWHVNPHSGLSMIDHYWGNPSAEIIGYLYEYSPYVQKLSIDDLVKQAMEHLWNMEELESSHETFCYMRLYQRLPVPLQKNMYPYLKKSIDKLICKDVTQYSSYVPTPLSFYLVALDNPFHIDDQLIQLNFSYLIEKVKKDGWIEPTWKWNQFEETWEKQKNIWAARLTVDFLTMLKAYN